MELFDRRGVVIRHAEDIRFDNATSGLAATNVQAAIDELVLELPELIEDTVATLVQNTASVLWTYDDAGNHLTADVNLANAFHWSAVHTFDLTPVVPNDSWTYAKLQNATALSLLGRASNSSGDLADIAAGSDGQVLLRNGSALAFTAPTAPAAGLTISTGLTFALANDLSALEGLASAGFAARTATDTWAIRTLQPPAAGITITNPAGTAGDPTLVLANDLAALEGLSTTGVAVRTATDTWTTRTNTGTANRITVTNGDGVSGAPTYDISATYVGQTSITTLGTVTTGTWNGTTLAPAYGGLGSTAVPTNGQLPIGNGTTYTAASLTAPAAGISITGGSGSITFALTNDLSALEGLSSTGFAARTTTDTWAQRTLTAPAAGFTITNPAGIAGNPTFVLANDLSAVEGLSTNGVAVRTATDTWTTRTITGTSSRLSVSNGDGVSGNPTLDIDVAYVGQSSITTLGTITTGTWNGTAITYANLQNATALSVLGRSANSSGVLADIAAGSDGDVLRRSGTSIGFGSIVLAASNFANPSSPGVDLSGANGTAVTAMRSDAKLVLDQTIAPTMTGIWQFNNTEVYLRLAKTSISSITGIDLTTVVTASRGVQAFGAANPGQFIGVRINTSFASPSTVASGNGLAILSGSGYDGTTIPALTTTGAGSFSINASQAWTATAHGTQLRLSTTTDDTVTNTERVRIGADSTGGYVRGPDGTTALPGASYLLDTDTGRSRIGTNSMGDSTAGLLRLAYDSGGRLIIGMEQTTALIVGGATAQIQLLGTSGNSAGLSITEYSNDTAIGLFDFGKSRGTTAGSYTAVVSGDTMGGFRYSGADGTDLSSIAADIRGEVDAAVSTGIVPGRIRFRTANSAGTNTDAFRINSFQQCLFEDGTAALPSASFRLNTNTGFRRVTTNTIGVSSNGAEVARWSTTAYALLTDSYEVQLGASSDLRLFHDGTNSIVRNDTGAFRIQKSTTVLEEMDTNYVDCKVRPRRTGGSTPAALGAGNNNDYSIAANIAEVRLTPNAGGSTITGIANPTAGDQLRLWNISTTVAITLLSDDGATSTAANRFLLPSGTNTTIQPGGCADLSYDGTSARWRQINRVA